MPYLERVQKTLEQSPHRFLDNALTADWLTQYEKRTDSIFRYYSIENEVDLIKRTKELSPEKQAFYLEENIKRFLGEFVGKIPYTTIPYEIDEKGFSFAGMHVMDSYQNAARRGGDREKAEIYGFEQIEKRFESDSSPQSAFWISPPKNWDYGFVFILEKDTAGKVKEYILRYPEKQGELKQSSWLFSQIENSAPLPENTDDYLRRPIFAASHNSRDNLETIMRYIGTDERKIAESRIFEEQIESWLGIWIAKYGQIIRSLTMTEPGSPIHKQGVVEAKKILLAIYQQAEKIQEENKWLAPYREKFSPYLKPPEPFDQRMLFAAASQMQTNNGLPTTSGGSCPTINNGSSPTNEFISNSDMKKALSQNITIEQLITKSKDYRDDPDLCHCSAASGPHFHCPGIDKKTNEPCQHAIVVGEGTTTCPICGMSKTC